MLAENILFRWYSFQPDQGKCWIRVGCKVAWNNSFGFNEGLEYERRKHERNNWKLQRILCWCSKVKRKRSKRCVTSALCWISQTQVRCSLVSSEIEDIYNVMLRNRNVLIDIFKNSSSYVTGLVKEKKKFIIFGYHMAMLNALSDCIKGLNVDFIRIDGTTRSDHRATYIERFQKVNSCRVAVLSLKGMKYPVFSISKSTQIENAISKWIFL